MWGNGDIFQRDCKYDGDKPMDGQQEQEGSFDSYNPVVGKWMTQFSGHHTYYSTKVMKSLYAEFKQTERS